MKYMYLFMLAGLAGCAEAQSVIIHPIYLNDGTLGMSVKCDEEADCMREAGNICVADGYEVRYNTMVNHGEVTSSSGSATKVFGTVIANSSEVTRSINTHNFMFTCNTLPTYGQYITLLIKRSGQEFVEIDKKCYWNKTMNVVDVKFCKQVIEKERGLGEFN